MTQTAQVIEAIAKLSKANHLTIAVWQIASVSPLSPDQIYPIICKLVKVGKLKKVGDKQTYNTLHNQCNIYMVVNPDHPITTQSELFK